MQASHPQPELPRRQVQVQAMATATTVIGTGGTAIGYDTGHMIIITGGIECVDGTDLVTQEPAHLARSAACGLLAYVQIV